MIPGRTTSLARHTYGSALRLGLRQLWRKRRLGIPFIGLTMLQGAFQALLIYAITEVLQGTELFLGALLVFGVWCLRAWSTYAATMLSSRIAYQIEIEAMGTVLRRMLRQPVAFFDEYSRGDLVISAYQDAGSLRIVTLQVGRTIIFATRVIGLGTAAFILSPKLALLGLACVPVALIPAYMFGSRIRRASETERETKTTLHDNFLQVAKGAPTIKVYGIGRRIMERAHGLGNRLRTAVIDRIRRAGLSTLVLEAASGVGLAVMIGVGGAEVANGDLSWPGLVGILMALIATYQPVVGLLQSYNATCTMLPSLDKATHFGQRPAETDDERGRVALRAPPERITLEGVEFGYGEESVLAGVSLEFRRGETIGIVGPTGAGKSTLMALLMGLRKPSRGSVRYDRHDLHTLRERDVRAHMALVPQEPVMFMGTIAENIRIGRWDASPEEVEQAARSAEIHDEILAMPRGYETLIGASGVSLEGEASRGLSVGQKQRVSIAAAILKGAPLVFLDEATSSVDSATEHRIQQATDHLLEGRTAFVIAHRLSTVRQSSRLIVLVKGRVEGFGTHTELMDTCPAYQELWRTQTGMIVDEPAS